MTQFDKKELDEKFITDNRKYRNIKCVVETRKNVRTQGHLVKR